jgi:hypothetical protein
MTRSRHRGTDNFVIAEPMEANLAAHAGYLHKHVPG